MDSEPDTTPTVVTIPYTLDSDEPHDPKVHIPWYKMIEIMGFEL